MYLPCLMDVDVRHSEIGCIQGIHFKPSTVLYYVHVGMPQDRVCLQSLFMPRREAGWALPEGGAYCIGGRSSVGAWICLQPLP